MMGGLGIGLPPVLNFGLPQNRPLQEKCIKECLSGEKIICLCITEPGAGSDVAGGYIESPPATPRVYMSIHTQGKPCPELGWSACNPKP